MPTGVCPNDKGIAVTPLPSPRARLATTWLIVACLIAAAACGMLLWDPAGPPSEREDSVRVVAAPTRALPIAPAPAVPATMVDPATALETATIAAFPMLHAVQVVCEPDCVVIATLGPNASSGEWPRANWPYDGNVERFLTAQGYVPLAPMTVDQPGDSDTLMRVPVRLPSRGGG